MAIFKFIDIPNYNSILLDLEDYLKNKTDVVSNPIPGGHPESFANMLDKYNLLENIPELREWLSIHKLIVCYVVVFGINPIAKNLLHADNVLPNGDNDVRILLPIQNTKGSLTRFFDVPSDQIVSAINSNGTQFRSIIGKGPFKLIDQVELIKPIVINTCIPHDIVVNKDLGYRVSLGIGFENPPYHWLED
jgi:hypothetical protein